MRYAYGAVVPWFRGSQVSEPPYLRHAHAQVAGDVTKKCRWQAEEGQFNTKGFGGFRHHRSILNLGVLPAYFPILFSLYISLFSSAFFLSLSLLIAHDIGYIFMLHIFFYNS